MTSNFLFTIPSYFLPQELSLPFAGREEEIICGFLSGMNTKVITFRKKPQKTNFPSCKILIVRHIIGVDLFSSCLVLRLWKHVQRFAPSFPVYSKVFSLFFPPSSILLSLSAQLIKKKKSMKLKSLSVLLKRKFDIFVKNIHFDGLEKLYYKQLTEKIDIYFVCLHIYFRNLVQKIC